MSKMKTVVVETRGGKKSNSETTHVRHLQIAVPTRAQERGVQRLLDWEKRSAKKDEVVSGRR